MFIVYDDMTVSLNRGDVGVIPVPQSKDGDYGYSISAGDILRIRVFPKKKCEEVALVKDFLIETATSVIELELDGTDTKIGDIINKPTTYWYEIELNPDTHPQTIVGYNEDGPKIFMLYPEGDDSGELPSINTGKPVTVSDEAVKSIINNEIFQEALKKVVSVIEQHYNSKSSNAQSGTAVAEAVKELHDTVAKWMTDMKNNVVVPGDNEVKQYVDEEIKKIVFGSDSDVTDEKLSELIAQYIKNNPVITIDDKMSETSKNPVQNKVIYQTFNALIADINKSHEDIKTNILDTVVAFAAANYVAKEEGKGLSSNDFTDGYKAKLDNIDDALEDVIANIDGIPDYWQDALDNGANAIRQAMESAGRNKSAFLFYSDAHWDYGSQMSPKLLKYLYKNTAINKTFFGGDVVNSESTNRDTMEYLYVWREMLKGLPNHHSVVGNHDDGNATNNLFSENYIYAYLLAAEETPQVVQGEGMYYYIDEPCEKTRYLFLDTAYKGVDDTQTAFITEALKSTQSGWHIVVVSHIWYLPDYNQYSVRPIPIAGLDTNATKVITLLDNYNSRTGDFADCEGKVEFCIGGHVHRDYVDKTAGGIPIILVETDSQHIRSDLSYTAGTTTESSVNGIIADYNNQVITVVRVGRGDGSTISLENGETHTHSYTSEITTAATCTTAGMRTYTCSCGHTYTVTIPAIGHTYVDGVCSVCGAENGNDTTTYTNVLDEVGWTENRRLSASSGVLKDETTETDVTGFITCSNGVMVYMKNVVTPPEISGTPYHGVYCYDENKTYLGGYSILECADIDFDTNTGDITMFMSPDGSDYANTHYIRIGAQDINETSIISVGVPIE